jgi:hypothetical protein
VPASPSVVTMLVCLPRSSTTSSTLAQSLTTPLSDIGANPSAEDGGDEGAEDATSTVIDVVYSFRLNETSFDKKSYLGHLKQYMKKVKETMKTNGASDEEVKEFETGAQTFAKKVVSSFKDWEFFTGESMDPDGMIVLLNYREDGSKFYTRMPELSNHC